MKKILLLTLLCAAFGCTKEQDFTTGYVTVRTTYHYADVRFVNVAGDSLYKFRYLPTHTIWTNQFKAEPMRLWLSCNGYELDTIFTPIAGDTVFFDAEP